MDKCACELQNHSFALVYFSALIPSFSQIYIGFITIFCLTVTYRKNFYTKFAWLIWHILSEWATTFELDQHFINSKIFVWIVHFSKICIPYIVHFPGDSKISSEYKTIRNDYSKQNIPYGSKLITLTISLSSIIKSQGSGYHFESFHRKCSSVFGSIIYME